jgi:hypothetical protein
LFTHKGDVQFDDMRSQAYKQLKRVSDEKLFSVWDFQNDRKNLLTSHEMLA